MKFHTTCECCNRKTTAYTINLSEQMVEAFKMFIKKYVSESNPFDGIGGLKKGKIGLTNPQYSNFQNLRHFKIIEEFKGNRHPTTLGMQRYKNQVAIKSPAGFMGGITLPDNHEARTTHEPRKEFFMREVEKKYQDEKEKYQDEATSAKTIY